MSWIRIQYGRFSGFKVGLVSQQRGIQNRAFDSFQFTIRADELMPHTAGPLVTGG
jgi:hypothetical protein